MTTLLRSAGITAAMVAGSVAFWPEPARAATTPAASTAPVPITPGYFYEPLGRFEVTAISDGAYNFVASKFLSGISIRELSRKLSEAYLRDTYPQAINVYLIKTPDKLILVDAGLGEMPAKIPALLPILGKSGYGHFVQNMRAAGYAPEQITDILITHLHVDHIGGLVQDGKAAFPNATIRVDKHETDFWLSERQRKTHPDLAPLFEAASMALKPYQTAGRLKPFNGSVEIAPGVQSVPTPGHTPGHTSYLFQSEGHRLLVWGDVLHVPAAQFAHPAVTMKFDVDPATAKNSRETVLADTVRDNDQVAGAHLFFPGIGRVRRDGAGYEWVPIAYPDQ